ncbi:MAG TPA: hypothetical protein VK464_17930, partial [Symbiobacteriaceae bacterium]|nr:hypothetical protein [Symbiobacteriaceae bacterium]
GRRAPTPHFSSPVFRYHLVRQVCLTLLTLRGRREWHKLEPLLEGPLFSLKPAYTEWLARFQAAQPAVRRAWHPYLVEQFAQREPAPPWFAVWCKALLDTEPDGAAEALAQTPALLCDPALLCEPAWPGASARMGEETASRVLWLAATALAWAARRGRTLRYEEAAARFRLDGVALPAWPAMQQTLEEAGLLVAGYPYVRLLLPVEVQAPAGALWPYAGPEWAAAALLEAGAFAVAAGIRRPERV